MIYAIIENGVVVNKALAEEPLDASWVASDTANIGDTYVDGEFIKGSGGNPNGIRKTRDFLLKKSDWTQLADAPVDKVAWATYRQSLRDVPEQEEFPDPNNINWPDAPE
jgi:hypothetical protein